MKASNVTPEAYRRAGRRSRVVPRAYPDQFDLLALAFQADITRVGSLLFARDLTNRTYPKSEAPTSSFHGESHHGEDPRRIANLSKINQYHVKMVAHLADRLKNVKEGDGNLLERTLILYGSNMGNSNQHVHYDVPHVLLGGANGKLKGGRHLALPTKQVPTGNLLLSVLDRFDIHQDKIGDRYWPAGESLMFLTRKHLPRRTFLKGAGVTLALPLLDSMIPASTLLAQTAAAPKQRFVGIFFPHGMAPGYWVPEKEGALGDKLPYILESLRPVQSQTTVLSGLW